MIRKQPLYYPKIFLKETGQLALPPKHLRFYFDYRAFARDLEINDVSTSTHGGQTHAFWNR